MAPKKNLAHKLVSYVAGIALCLCISTLYAQTTSYTAMRSIGEIPSDFIQINLSQSANENDEESLTGETENQQSNGASEFFVHSILNSGKVLYGDSITEYLNRVVDHLLKDQPDKREEIHIYTLKSTEGKLISTPTGLILVPVQIIAQAENEAQIAYLIAVEIARIQNDQYQNAEYPTKAQLSKTVQDFTAISPFQSWERPYPYLPELLADSLGYRLFRHAGYDSDAALNSLDVLQWCHLPFMDKPFQPDFFAFDSLQFPESYFLTTTKPLPYETEQPKDLYFEQRRSVLRQVSIIDKGKKGNTYVLDKAEFLRIKRIAQFETILTEMSEAKYVRAFYDLYCLNTKFPNDRFISESMGKALYGLTKYVSAEKHKMTDLELSKGYGNFEHCMFFLANLNAEHLTILTIRYLFDEVEKNKDPFMTRLLEDLLADGIDKKYLDLELLSASLLSARAKKQSTDANPDLSADNTKKPTEDAVIDDVESGAENSKFNRLRKVKNEVLSDTNMTAENSEFTTIFHINIQLNAFESVNFDRLRFYYSNATAAVKSRSTRRTNYAKLNSGKKQGKYSYGIDSLIFLNPSSFEFNTKHHLLIKSSQQKSLDFEQTVLSCGEAAEIASIKSSNNYTDQSSDHDFNRNALLQALANEIIFHTNHGVQMISLQSQYTSTEIESTGIRHCCLTSISHNKKWRKTNTYIGTGLSLPIFIAAPFASPIAFSIAFTKAHNTQLAIVVIDLENSELVYAHQDQIKYKNSDGIVNSFLYYNLARLQTTIDQ